MMRAWVLILLSGLAACGTPAVAPEILLSMRQALRAEVATVEIAAFDSSNTCPDLSAAKADWQSWGLCADGVYSGSPPCKIVRAQLTVGEFDPSRPINLYVPAGRRTFAAVGLDEASALVGFGCSGPLSVDAGGTARVELTLE